MHATPQRPNRPVQVDACAGPDLKSEDPKHGAPERTDGEMSPRRSRYAKIAVGAALGSQFVGSAAGGVIVGVWLDGRYGTGPWATIVGSVLGLVAGLVILIRMGRAASGASGGGPG